MEAFKVAEYHNGSHFNWESLTQDYKADLDYNVLIKIILYSEHQAISPDESNKGVFCFAYLEKNILRHSILKKRDFGKFKYVILSIH